MRKQGLANQCACPVRAIDKRKVTPGITELSPARVPIDLEACYFDVGSAYPGGAAATKGGVVRPLKGIVSWVYTVARQVCCFLAEVRGSLTRRFPQYERNGESAPLVHQLSGRASLSSHALRDKG